MNLSTILPHDLIKMDAAQVILGDDKGNQCAAPWVVQALWETSMVVVRRAIRTRDLIPVGIRGPERSQRWAAWCPANAIRQIVTPADLLERLETSKGLDSSPAWRALRLLAVDWQWLTHSWGPGGSVGFELATGKRTTTLRSDLDIVIYANDQLSRSIAQRLLVRARGLDVPVDIRVETPLCGFSLAEYAGSSGKSILLRTCAGPVLGDDPWSRDACSISAPTEGCPV
jgi:phosphoribosyl-dephospho-CoA transferase